jgi:hypothetical protein
LQNKNAFDHALLSYHQELGKPQSTQFNFMNMLFSLAPASHHVEGKEIQNQKTYLVFEETQHNGGSI